MITNFEKYTAELTEYEQQTLIPILVKGLKKYIGKQNSITAKEIIEVMQYNNHKIDGARFRKLIQYIRMTGLVERLVATSKGYYICNSKKEMDKYIESLLQRAGQIEMLAKQMQFQINKLK